MSSLASGKKRVMLQLLICIQLLICWISLFPFQARANPMLLKGDLSNETVSALPGPDPGYIIIESTYGLSNRLRVLAAYLFIAPIRFDNAKIIMIWDVNDACPAHFLSLFDPIPNVIFATNETRNIFDKHAKAIYPDTPSVFSYLLKMHGFPRVRRPQWNNPRWGEIEFMTYSQFYPRREILAKVVEYINKYDICNAHAIHVRSLELFAEQPNTVPFAMAHIENRPNNEPVFLLTDHHSIQDKFLSKYGPQKVLIYQHINATVNSWPRSIHHMKDTSNATRPHATDFRFTTLEQTLIEVLIAAHAKTFRVSPASSVSDLVNTFARVGKDRGWCTTDVYTSKRLSD